MKTQSHIVPLAIAQFRKDWPFMAARLDSMRVAAVSRGPACGDTAPAAGGDFSAAPHGNNGDNQINPTDKAVL